MGFVQGTSLVLLGLLGVASFARRHAKEHVVALCLIQFGMGGWATFWGWYRTSSAVLSLEWFSHAPVYWSTTTADAVVQLLLGLLLLAGMALTLMTGRDEAPRARRCVRRWPSRSS